MKNTFARDLKEKIDPFSTLFDISVSFIATILPWQLSTKHM